MILSSVSFGAKILPSSACTGMTSNSSTATGTCHIHTARLTHPNTLLHDPHPTYVQHTNRVHPSESPTWWCRRRDGDNHRVALCICAVADVLSRVWYFRLGLQRSAAVLVVRSRTQLTVLCFSQLDFVENGRHFILCVCVRSFSIHLTG